MISIVICSRLGQLEETMASNIKETIGNIEYETIIIDNSHNIYSIFSAYNMGLKSSKYPIVCFMHEDIKYKNKNWGNLVIDCFENPNVGLCGVIGSKYISEIPCGWWLSKSKRGHIIENRKDGDIIENFSTRNKELVATVDGVWFCLRKDLFPRILFDEETFNGFHCYDMDISLQILKLGYQLQIIPQIDIYHKSQGCTNGLFYFNCLLLFKKWKSYLPLSVDLDDNEKKENIILLNSYIKGVSKENFFYRYKNSLIFKLICTIEKVFKINLSDLFAWTYFRGFYFYVVFVNNKFLRKLL